MLIIFTKHWLREFNGTKDWKSTAAGCNCSVVGYGSKSLEFAKGKNAIELASEAEVADTLRKEHDVAEPSELDAFLVTVVQKQNCKYFIDIVLSN